MLKALALKQHDHLIKLLATYKFRGQYHLMFPFAISNLRQFWEQKEIHWSHEIFTWSLKQLHGIASALHTIHNFRSSTSDSGSVHNISQTDRFLGPLVNSGEEERYGRHGDIKPENILRMAGPPGSLGILQIADLGLGTFHTLGSRSNVEAKSVGGSPTYLPPECALNLPISRAYDIWSLGCVFLEFVIWLLDGPQGLAKFADDRLLEVRDGVYDDSFFIIELRSKTGKYAANVRPSVRKWIVDLYTHHGGSAFIHDLLDLITQKMLVARAQDRITSEKLSQMLGTFATKAANCEGYLLQELAVAKRGNENYFGRIPSHLNICFGDYRRIASLPVRKSISSGTSDSPAQQLVPNATPVLTKRIDIYMSATWSLSRESDAELAQSPVLRLKLAPSQIDPALGHFASHEPTAASTTASIRQITHLSSPPSSVDGTDSDEASIPSMEIEPSLGFSDASLDEDIFAFDQVNDDHGTWIANRNSSLFGLELPSKYPT
jgi:serine/threonine protein kinase